MEVLSTTNPTPPDGGTNASAPLSLSAALSITKSPQLNKEIVPDALFQQVPILIDRFKISNSQVVGATAYSWAVYNNGLAKYQPPTNNEGVGFLPWSLIQPYYSKMHKMEYALIFKPVKITDCETRLHALWDYAGSGAVKYTTYGLNNHNEQFSFDDASDLKVLSVPQFWITNNVSTNTNSYDEDTDRVNPYIPVTNLKLFVANTYQPNLTQPDNFEVMVFLMPLPSNMKVMAGRRMVQGALKYGDNVHILPRPYFFS
jgi:hypothetical protein